MPLHLLTFRCHPDRISPKIQLEGEMRMKGRRKEFMRIAMIVSAIIVLAAACRAIAFSTQNDFLDRLANFTRIFLYLSLFAVWGVSIQRRVLQVQVRHYLVTVVFLMIFWLTVREFRWHLVANENVKRWLWYAYYFGILLIPLLAFFISLSLGKPEEYRLPKWTAFLYLPTFALLALVLTNDLHQWVFVFPDTAANYSELNYNYGPLFYVLYVWGSACALAAIAVMLSKCRIPRTRKILWLPLTPFAMALLYVVLYAVRVPFVTGAFGDLAVFDCLLFTAFFESCIQCGLIQSNTRYTDLFMASSDISAQIVDTEYRVRYSASGATSFPMESMKKAETAPVVLPDGKRLHNMPVNGGHVIWTEDISELLNVQETLEHSCEELQDRNEFLQYAYEQEKEHRLVVEQNRLYDLLQNKTQRQFDHIQELTAAYQKAEKDDDKRRIIASIVVLGSYIKRRKDFILSMDSSPALPESKLTNALMESLRSLELLEVRGGCFVQTERELVDGDILTRAYDFFESIVETVMDSARYLNVAVRKAEGRLRCTVMTDCSGDYTEIRRLFPQVQIVHDEDGGTEYLLPLEGGGAE